MKPQAYCNIRPHPHYRREAFVKGLEVAGWQVQHCYPSRPPGPRDVLVIWNRYGEAEASADKWEKQGGTVFVAENGYVGHDAHGVQYYALSISQHNGAGRWVIGDGSRWEKLGIELKPWRTPLDQTRPGHIVVRGQRGIGSRLMASPPDWHKRIVGELKKVTPRPVKVLEHPGKPACDPEVVKQLTDALRGAHACVIWSSGAGIRALIEGVPVFFHAPHWICGAAGMSTISMIEHPMVSDQTRLFALQNMAWAQWTVAEIASGEAFVRLTEMQAITA